MDFVLIGTDGAEYSLRGFEEEYIVLFAYPKDNTPGWTSEALEFSELVDDFKKLGAKIVGISKDTVASHKKFVEKHNLSVLLLSDPDREVLTLLDLVIEKKMFGKSVKGTQRSTFIFDSERNIIKEFRSVKSKGHAADVLEYLKKYKNVE